MLPRGTVTRTHVCVVFGEPASRALPARQVFPPSRYQYQAFPEKKRFVLLSERDDVAAERLKHFQSYCSLFAMYPEVWDDPKVQRFFDLPRELRGKAGSLRHAQSSLSPRNKHSGGDDAKAGSNSPALLQALHRAKASPTSPPESGGVHRSDSNMFISSNLSSRDREALRPGNDDVGGGAQLRAFSVLTRLVGTQRSSTPSCDPGRTCTSAAFWARRTGARRAWTSSTRR